VKFGSFYQKSVNIGEFEDIGRFQISALKIGEFTEKSLDLASQLSVFSDMFNRLVIIST
jgi:hypothetical protein